MKGARKEEMIQFDEFKKLGMSRVHSAPGMKWLLSVHWQFQGQHCTSGVVAPCSISVLS